MCARLLEPAPVTIGPAPRGAGVRKVCCLTRAAPLPDALGLIPAGRTVDSNVNRPDAERYDSPFPAR